MLPKIKKNKNYYINLIKVKLVAFVSLLLLLVSADVFAENGYVIEDYTIEINIDKENNYLVSERIKADFQVPKHGIIRSIPTIYGDRNFKLSNIELNEKYSEKTFNSGVNLRIGDPNATITGPKEFLLSYKYEMGWDRNNEYDEVYFNLIGNEWDTTIEKFHFKITLPDTFDPNKISFTMGEFGSRAKGAVEYRVEGNSIIGSTTEEFLPNTALTLALPLPEGYFKVSAPTGKLNLIKNIIYVLSVGLVILAIYLWFQYGKNKKLVETVEFYPPDDMNPSEIGYFIDGRVDLKDITSLFIYWANKGFLDIREEGKDALFSKKEYFLTKNREIEATNNYEPYLFHSLFNYSGRNEVVVSQLKYKFYPVIEKTYELLGIDIAMNHRALYSKKSLSVAAMIGLFPFILLFLSVLHFSIDRNTSLLSSASIVALLTVPFRTPIVIVATLILWFISFKTRRRSDEYSEILGKVKGFKRFLETAEKSKLEELVDENPSYFYNILPYTIVLGVSDKWADKFNDIVKTPPNWYHSNSMDMFTMALFMKSFNRTMSSFNQDMFSTPPSSKGPGFSSMGGGSAGGGAGGGGGSSW